MSVLIRLIRIVFLPLLGIVVIVFPELKYKKYHITYTWYRNREHYDLILKNSVNPEACKTYDQWKIDAENRINEYKEKRIPFIKVAIIPSQVIQWLDINNLENSATNREKYAVAVYKAASDNGIENKI